MTGRGRPPIGPPVEVRLDRRTLAHIDAWAKAWQTSRSDMIRLVLDAGLEVWGPAPD